MTARQHAGEFADDTDEQLAELPVIGLAASANAENELVEGDDRDEVHADAHVGAVTIDASVDLVGDGATASKHAEHVTAELAARDGEERLKPLHQREGQVDRVGGALRCEIARVRQLERGHGRGVGQDGLREERPQVRGVERARQGLAAELILNVLTDDRLDVARLARRVWGTEGVRTRPEASRIRVDVHGNVAKARVTGESRARAAGRGRNVRRRVTVAQVGDSRRLLRQRLLRRRRGVDRRLLRSSVGTRRDVRIRGVDPLGETRHSGDAPATGDERGRGQGRSVRLFNETAEVDANLWRGRQGGPRPAEASPVAGRPEPRGARSTAGGAIEAIARRTQYPLTPAARAMRAAQGADLAADGAEGGRGLGGADSVLRRAEELVDIEAVPDRRGRLHESDQLLGVFLGRGRLVLGQGSSHLLCEG